MTGDPLLVGSVQLTVTVPLGWTAAAALVGGAGTVGMVTEFERVEGSPVPSVLMADTVKVYEVPLVRPVIVVEVADPPDTDMPVHAEHVGYGLTVYPVIGEPLAGGSVQLRVTDPLALAVAVPMVGLDGAVADG